MEKDTPLTEEPVLVVTEKDLEDQLSNCPTLAVVLFFAEWSAPCRMLLPLFQEVAKERAGTLSFFKINADKSPGSVQQFQITALPTILFLDKNQLITRLSGTFSKGSLHQHLDRFQPVPAAV